MATSITRRTFGRIRRFLRGDGVSIAYQPIADLDTGAVVGFESLARFDGTPPRSPAAWFEDADVAGLRRDLELTTARAAVRALCALPRDVYLTVNASPDVAMSPAFLEAIARAAGPRLVIEITEHARIDDYDALNAALAVLRSRGVRVAIDDAGAGFANMTHILRLDADLIKLDVEITRHIDIDARRKALVASLVEFSRSVGATLVAEGIETEAQLAALRRLGVRTGQGYHLGRPAPLPGPAAAGARPDAPPAGPSLATSIADVLSFARTRRAERRAARRPGWARRGLLVAIVGALLLGPGALALADTGGPGTPGYWIKRRIEDLRLLVALDRESEIRLHMDFAGRRLNELAEQIADGDDGEAGMILADYRRHLVALERFLPQERSIPAGLQLRIERELATGVIALAEANGACPAGSRSASCRAIGDAERHSRAALATAERARSGKAAGRSRPAPGTRPSKEPPGRTRETPAPTTPAANGKGGR